MTRTDKDKYMFLIRDDYLYELGQIRSSRQDRDEIIVDAVKQFLAYPFRDRQRKIEQEEPRLRITRWAGEVPTYNVYLDAVNMPDSVVAALDRINRYPDTDTPIYQSLDTVLNAAIRLYLENEGKLEAQQGSEAVGSLTQEA